MTPDEVKAVNGVLDACASDQCTDDWVADVASATVAWEAAGSPVVPDEGDAARVVDGVICNTRALDFFVRPLDRVDLQDEKVGTRVQIVIRRRGA